ncbi:MAG TPA: hybrid sensor histidine kinase/response regulator [Vicinamibacterales bacterium]|nr:hybrid sensor histidine kinase/response regulator [Vicinamibacterales bacterium]
MSRPADAYPFPTFPAPLRFAIAMAAVSVVFIVDATTATALDEVSKFLLLGTAVLASAWFAGTGPALAAVILGAALGWVGASREPATVAQVATHLALFVLQGLLLTAVVSELRAARRSAERQTRVALAARREGEAANRMKDQFLATVSHELRTPLNAMLGWVHLLRTGKLDRDLSDRGLETIERNVKLQAQLTGDLLEVSKALTGELQLECQPTTIGEAARQAASAAESAARAKEVSLDVTIPKSPVVVLGDPARLRQIVWHLLSNAIKFTPRGGRVAVVAATHGDEATLKVTDSGPGIDPSFLPRIFDCFTQADSSLTRVSGGLGVGLALVKQLVELHGGEIEARNRDDAAGAIFIIRLPAQSVELREFESRREISTVGPFATDSLHGMRVLVVDHDIEAHELLRTVLHQRGAEVQIAGSVAEGLESLEAWHPDVLVSDADSPRHDSYSLVGRVESLDSDRGGRIPALALTARGRSDPRLGRLISEVHRDLPKPVEPALLTAEIARLARRDRRRARP